MIEEDLAIHIPFEDIKLEQLVCKFILLIVYLSIINLLILKIIG